MLPQASSSPLTEIVQVVSRTYCVSMSPIPLLSWLPRGDGVSPLGSDGNAASHLRCANFSRNFHVLPYCKLSFLQVCSMDYYWYGHTLSAGRACAYGDRIMATTTSLTAD